MEKNVFSKLAVARKLIGEKEIRKNGKGHGFNFFEKEDFLPHAVEIFEKLGLATETNINMEIASMKVTCADTLTAMTFSIPYSQFRGQEKRKLQEVQELGGSVTYLTRYLWIEVLSLSEGDTVDSHRNSAPVQSQSSRNYGSGNFNNNSGTSSRFNQKAPEVPNNNNYGHEPIMSNAPLNPEDILNNEIRPYLTHDNVGNIIGSTVQYRVLAGKRDGQPYGGIVDDNMLSQGFPRFVNN